MTEEDLQGGLEAVRSRFDLGEYEIEAYLAVLDHGELTAAEIAERTDVPQPRVYDTARSLSESGLVELRESRPMRVLAVDPAEAFAGVQSTLSTLLDRLAERYQTPARGAEAVSLVGSRPTIRRYLEDVITTAEYELVLSLTPALLARFEEQLQERRDGGVTIELLLAPAEDAPAPEAYDYGRVATEARARRGVTTPVVAVADGTYSVYTTHGALSDEEEDRYGVIFNRSELGFLVSAFLNVVVWPSATTLSECRGDRPFPRHYATTRRCVADLADADGEFHASMRGRDVESGRRRTVSGAVVDVSVGTNRETATITLDTGEGLVDVGGQVAAIEDLEADVIAVDRGCPPEV
ncbi:ArsR family transcriptional regulator [Halobacteriales archaeon QH_7_69_31]|nr:MAG: ArsR family transcriptional regulator [Halobacteriales archaeon QH_7_69_31]